MELDKLKESESENSGFEKRNFIIGFMKFW